MSIRAVPSDDLVEVRLLAVPIARWSEAQEHAEGLLREFTLITASTRRADAPQVPRRLLELMEELERDYATVSDEQDETLHAAASAGRESVDLSYRVPRSVADACRRLADALDAADEFCRSDEHLLSLATPAGALAFRQWFLGEFIRQVSGEGPRPWPQWLEEREEREEREELEER